MGKSWKKWRKVGKSWNKWRKVGISGETWGKVGKSGTFFCKMAAPAILDDQKSLSIAFLAISDQYATFIFFNLFSKWPPAAILEVPFWPFWMTENHFRSHFSPFQINTQLFFLNFFSKWPPAAILEVRFAPKTIEFFHYVLSMAMPNMKLIGEFVTQLERPQAFSAFLYKMAAKRPFCFSD